MMPCTICSVVITRLPILFSLRHFHSTTPRFFSQSTHSLRLSTPPLAFPKRSSSLLKVDPIATPEDIRYEGPLKIVEYPDPILRAKNKRVGVFDDELKRLVDEMFHVMYKTDGIGLSAPQVGINVQLMVFNPAGEPGKGKEIVLINPKVTKYSKNKVVFNEGCLSFPGIYADVERPESVKIDASDVSGSRFSVNLSGLPARVFQHEFDHLQEEITRKPPMLQWFLAILSLVFLLVLYCMSL